MYPANKISALFIILFVILVAGCDKQNNTGTGGTNAAGRFSAHTSCSVIAPPQGVNLNSYYKKYINCSGIPVAGDNNIPDEALKTADETIAFMLRGLDAVKSKLVAEGAYYALASHSNEGLFVIPEMDNDPQAGKYFSEFPIAISSVDNLLCLHGNSSPGTNVLVHEFAHMMHLSALALLHPSFNSELESAYNNAKSKGLWKNTYSMTNAREYLAVAITIWYGVMVEGKAGGDGFHNEIVTREALLQYDPTLHNFISRYFNAERDIPGCVRPPATGNKPCVSTVADIDGNVYDVVAIGNQCWMKQNLKTSRFRDGTPIMQATNATGWQDTWLNTTSPAFAYYDHNALNNASYGKLYNWTAASDARICPDGWHIPSQQEVNLLIKQVGGKTKAGALMATTGWDNNPGATNSSGFSLLPGGLLIQGGFEGKGTEAYIWTTNEGFNNDFTIAVAGEWRSGKESVTNLFPKNSGISCRCVMD